MYVGSVKFRNKLLLLLIILYFMHVQRPHIFFCGLFAFIWKQVAYFDDILLIYSAGIEPSSAEKRRRKKIINSDRPRQAMTLCQSYMVAQYG